MTLLEAFGAIFTAIWLFISSPMMMVLIGLVLLIVGVILVTSSIFVPHVTRSELVERVGAGVVGLLMGISGVAVMMWAVSSSSGPTTWGLL